MLRKGNSQDISNVFEVFLKSNGMWKKYLETKIANNWDSIVGKKIASYTTSIQIKDQKMYLSVSSSVLRSELLMLKSNLIDVVNTKAGENLINEIIIR